MSEHLIGKLECDALCEVWNHEALNLLNRKLLKAPNQVGLSIRLVLAIREERATKMQNQLRLLCLDT